MTIRSESRDGIRRVSNRSPQGSDCLARDFPPVENGQSTPAVDRGPARRGAVGRRKMLLGQPHGRTMAWFCHALLPGAHTARLAQPAGPRRSSWSGERDVGRSRSLLGWVVGGRDCGEPGQASRGLLRVGGVGGPGPGAEHLYRATADASESDGTRIAGPYPVRASSLVREDVATRGSDGTVDSSAPAYRFR